jgi:hypothetical protein
MENELWKMMISNAQDYLKSTTDNERDPQAAFDKAFEAASKAEFLLYVNEGDNLDIMTFVDEELGKVGIVRIFAEEVTTDLV